MIQGVYANLTIQLYTELDIGSLRVWGALYGAATLLVWSLVFLRTLSMLRAGQIFESPCIEEADLAQDLEQVRLRLANRDLLDGETACIWVRLLVFFTSRDR